jgi:hypothetical protein
MLFEQPFEQFVLTTYTFANWEWVVDWAGDGRSVPFRAEAETAEFAELVSYFAREYPGKQFVLKNWEGDWQLQGNFDLDGGVSPERLEDFIEWMRARQAGVVRGRAGEAQVNVQHALEFNLLQRAVRNEVAVLRDVVPKVDSDLISYSSWETSQSFDTRLMRDAIAFLEAMPANRGREVLIAEFGHVNQPADRAATDRVHALLRAFVDEGVNAFFWQIFNNGVPHGLINQRFERSDAWFALREALGVKNGAAIDWDLTSVAERVPAGVVLSIKAAFINTGRPWYRAVGYQLELLGPNGVDLGEISWLPHDVPTFGRVTFEFELRAATTPGTYRLQMAERGIEVFGDPIAFNVTTASDRT